MHTDTNQLIFRTPYFALMESAAVALLAGGHATYKQPRLASNQIGVFGLLGQNDPWADSDYAAIRADVRRAAADPRVKSIDLVIDSPGGSVLGLPETADVIAAAARIKPVRSIVAGIAGSAAYWLASQGSTIRVAQSSEVGSVGVFDVHADVSGMLEKAGVKLTAVTAGEFKTERAPFTPLSDGARANMQEGVNTWYQEFLSAVRRGRGARVVAGSKFGDGRMLSAKAALQMGMIDFIGGIE